MGKEVNETLIQMFEWYLPEDGKFWNYVKEQAGYLQELGITKAWLPPAYKGAQGIKDVGYGVYDMYDLGEFDQKGTIPTKYGTKDEYLAAIKSLQKENIEVLGDVVFNHRMGADEKEVVKAAQEANDNRNHEITDDLTLEVWTKFTFPGRNKMYSDFCWNASHFDGTDWDDRTKKNGVYLFEGKSWEEKVDKQFGNYDYLMGSDLDISNPEVKEELLRWGRWYFDFTGIDGVRLDAVKHICSGFFAEWLTKLRTELKKEIFAVGEYWSPDVNALLDYRKQSENKVKLFDVPLHFNFYHCAKSNGTFDMRNMWKDTLCGRDSEQNVQFVDNHDTQPGQALESFVMEWFKPLAYALILLRNDGIPCVFYGDLYGIPHNGIKPVKGLETLLKIRKDFLYGAEHNYIDDHHCVGWTREGAEGKSAVAVILTNECRNTKKMYVGTRQKGKQYADVLANRPETVLIDEEGYGLFPVEGGSVSVYMEKGEL